MLGMVLLSPIVLAYGMHGDGGFQNSMMYGNRMMHNFGSHMWSGIRYSWSSVIYQMHGFRMF
jgi:hypothetical protein